MSVSADEFDTEEAKVLREALSDTGLHSGPSDEFAARLRDQLLSVTVPARTVIVRTVRGQPHQRIWIASAVGAGIAAILLAGVWHFSARPTLAAAISAAREQAWIHAEIARDGSHLGDLWVAPERDIVEFKAGPTVLILDYMQQTFLRCDLENRSFRSASQPDNVHLMRDLASMTTLASVFRRSPGIATWLPDQPIDRWKLRSTTVDGLPVDEYEIVAQMPGRPETKLVLTVDRRQSLPQSLVISEFGSPDLSYRFDYPAFGPDKRSLGIPDDARFTDIDGSGQISSIAQTLVEDRSAFDDYTALCVASGQEKRQPLNLCDLKRVVRRGNKWRVDIIQTDADVVLPEEIGEAKKMWHANKDQFHLVPYVICDGRTVRHYKLQNEGSGAKEHWARPKLERVGFVTGEQQVDSHYTPLGVPERCCRPIFQTSAPDQNLDGPFAGAGLRDGLIEVDVFATAKDKSNDVRNIYWLNPALGNVAVSNESYRGLALRDRIPATLQNDDGRIVFRNFERSPRGYWYPTLVQATTATTGRITRFYVDFKDESTDELFGPADPTQ
jgi:hypothetical protein